MVWPLARVKPRVQPLTAVLLVMVMLSTSPLFQALSCWVIRQPPPPTGGADVTGAAEVTTGGRLVIGAAEVTTGGRLVIGAALVGTTGAALRALRTAV